MMQEPSLVAGRQDPGVLGVPVGAATTSSGHVHLAWPRLAHGPADPHTPTPGGLLQAMLTEPPCWSTSPAGPHVPTQPCEVVQTLPCLPLLLPSRSALPVLLTPTNLALPTIGTRGRAGPMTGCKCKVRGTWLGANRIHRGCVVPNPACTVEPLPGPSPWGRRWPRSPGLAAAAAQTATLSLEPGDRRASRAVD